MEEKKNCLFENKTKLNANELIVQQNFELKKYMILVAVCVSLISCAIGVPVILFFNAFFGGAIIILGILAGAVLIPYLIKDSIKKQNEYLFGGGDYENVFQFYDDTVVVIGLGKDDDNKKSPLKELARQEFQYNDFYKVVVYQTYLFLYINKRQSFMLNQKTMTKGTSGEVIDLFKGHDVKIVDNKHIKGQPQVK